MSSPRDACFGLGASAAGGLSPLLIGAMVATCRVTCPGPDLLDRARQGEASIGMLWHHDLVFFGDHLRGSAFSILASQGRDGEIGARIAHRLGLHTVRGLSSRGAEQALAELSEIARRGECIGFVADGSARPEPHRQDGADDRRQAVGTSDRADAVRGARRLVSALVGPHARAGFARTVVRAGGPISVPQHATREDYERLRQRLQDERIRNEAIAAQAL